jgi:hypothetical protein
MVAGRSNLAPAQGRHDRRFLEPLGSLWEAIQGPSHPCPLLREDARPWSSLIVRRYGQSGGNREATGKQANVSRVGFILRSEGDWVWARDPREKESDWLSAESV